MALIVEDGTGKPDAESFISVADATAYHAARGNAAWAALASDTLREQALRKGTDYMEQMYRERWAGTRLTATQALSWPRYMVPMKDAPGGYGSWPAYYPQDEVPLIVAHACAELALRAAAGELAPDIDRVTTREKVGPLEVEYAAGAAPYVRFRAVDNMLTPFFGAGGGMNIAVIRA
jgi:hypothetical protein